MADLIQIEVEDLDTLADSMEEVLAVTTNTLLSFGIEIPDRRFISFGKTVHDCEQLTVSFVQMYLGPPGDQAQGPAPCGGPRTAVFQIQLVRCTPVTNLRTKKVPDQDELTAFTRSQAKDAWALLESATQYDRYEGVIADVALTEVDGGYQAVVLNLVKAL